MRYCSIFLLNLLLPACESTDKQRTALPIPREKVVSVMVDMHLVETAHNMKLTEGDSIRPSYSQLCEAIFVQHGISPSAFDSALYVLSFRPKEMSEVYDLVLERLSELDAKVAVTKE